MTVTDAVVATLAATLAGPEVDAPLPAATAQTVAVTLTAKLAAQQLILGTDRAPQAAAAILDQHQCDTQAERAHRRAVAAEQDTDAAAEALRAIDDFLAQHGHIQGGGLGEAGQYLDMLREIRAEHSGRSSTMPAKSVSYGAGLHHGLSATFQRHLPVTSSGAEHFVYRLSSPVLVSIPSDTAIWHVVVSKNVLLEDRPETFIFPCNPEGMIDSPMLALRAFCEDITPQDALSRLGYAAEAPR